MMGLAADRTPLPWVLFGRGGLWAGPASLRVPGREWAGAAAVRDMGRGPWRRTMRDGRGRPDRAAALAGALAAFPAPPRGAASEAGAAEALERLARVRLVDAGDAGGSGRSVGGWEWGVGGSESGSEEGTSDSDGDAVVRTEEGESDEDGGLTFSSSARIRVRRPGADPGVRLGANSSESREGLNV
jgi:hypothetical protein